MKKIAVVIVALLTLVVVVYFDQKQKFGIEKMPYPIYTSGPLKFQVAPIEKIGVAARILNKDYTDNDLYEKSPVLVDLTKQEVHLLVEAALAKADSLLKSENLPQIKLYKTQPQQDLKLKEFEEKAQITFSQEIPTFEGALLEIDGRPYQRSDLLLNQVQLSRIQTDLFYEKLNVLQDLYKKALLLKEAQQKGITIQKYITENVIPDPEVSNVEVIDFARKNNLDLSEKSQDLKQTLKIIIEQNKRNEAINQYVSRNFPHEIGTIYFFPPRYKIPLYEQKALMPITANKAEKPTFLVFSNFNCSTCKLLAQELGEIKKNYNDQIRIGFVQFFSENDWRSRMIAEASFCINAQSHSSYWDFLVKMAQIEGNVDERKINELAQNVDADYDQFKKCFIAQTYKKEVDEQVKYAQDLGVQTSPTVIIGTEVLQGAIQRSQLTRAIEASKF